jgi:O-antigen ligase
MIRVTLLWLVVLALAAYAWRDWFRALCGLILLMAVIEHPDMPKNLLGIQGLNPWNLLLLSVLLAWAAHRRQEGLRWDMPRHVTVLLVLYLLVVVIGFVRMMADRASIEHFTTSGLVAEYLVNSVKWVVPGLLLFDGCRSRARLLLGLGCILAVYVLLSLQVIRWMPLEAAWSGESLSRRSAKILVNEVGYHRVNLSTMLAGASWAILATLPLARRTPHRLLIVGAALTVVFAQALTGGRAGYVAWAVVGLVLGLARWRRLLPLAPVVAAVLLAVLPGVQERALEGVEDSGVDEYRLTAGRNIAWPHVIEKIQDAPVIGFGRLAMQRTGLRARLEAEEGEDFSHPHNAYLEALLDNGLAGLAVILSFYLAVLVHGISLFRDRRSPVFAAAGGVALALVLAPLVASLGSQTFYPREGAVGMWGAIGLLLRVLVERSRARAPLPARALEEARARPWWQAEAART